MNYKGMMGGLAAAIVAGMVTGLVARAEEHPAVATKEAAAKAQDVVKCQSAKPQTLCPICGNKTVRDAFVDVEGMRIYLCSKSCPVDKVTADPKSAIAKIRANGEEPCPVSVVCSKCGQFMGSDKCCKADAVKCDKCGLIKGSPGCCKPDVLGQAIFSGTAKEVASAKEAAPVKAE